MGIKEEADAHAHVEAATLFGAGDQTTIEEHNRALDERQQREWAESQAKLDREVMLRTVDYKQKEYDANLHQIKNTRRTLKVRVADMSMVPKEFLIITLNEEMAVAAGKAGQKIPGLEFYEDIRVNIGRNTYAPRIRSE